MKDDVLSILILLLMSMMHRSSGIELGRLPIEMLKKTISHEHFVAPYSLSSSQLQLVNSSTSKIILLVCVDFILEMIFRSIAVLTSRDWKQVHVYVLYSTVSSVVFSIYDNLCAFIL